ncbi:MAG: GDSL-type esterase/lipase family protein [Candidatus Bathyarchaeia archaeon]|jgi:lysophospholipase L1-like esterase
MNKKKLRLVAIGLVILIASSGMAAYFILNIETNKTPANKIRVACIGDSITEGTEYPPDLWMLLGANYTVSNFGVGGTTVSFDSQSPYINTSAFQKSLEFQPNIVIIMLGTNDAHPINEQYNGSFVDNYVELVARFQALVSKPKIWIVLPPPVFSNESGVSPEYFMLTVIPGIEQAANETNLPVINVYSALANYSEYFLDGVHPNSAGAQIIANIIYNSLNSDSA